jgi:hypothetical protein
VGAGRVGSLGWGDVGSHEGYAVFGRSSFICNLEWEVGGDDVHLHAIVHKKLQKGWEQVRFCQGSREYCMA